MNKHSCHLFPVYGHIGQTFFRVLGCGILVEGFGFWFNTFSRINECFRKFVNERVSGMIPALIRVILLLLP